MRVAVKHSIDKETISNTINKLKLWTYLAAVAGSPEGRGCMDAHVKIPNEMLDVIPPPTGDDKAVIEELADPASLDKHSRLGSRIILSKSLQGAVLSIGDIYPWKTL